MGFFFKKKVKEEVQYTASSSDYEDFRMTIDDVFLIMGRGVVAVGMVAAGGCKVGDPVQIQTITGTIESTITGLEAFRKPLQEAYAGQHVGVLLRGVAREQLSKGDTITMRNTGF